MSNALMDLIYKAKPQDAPVGNGAAKRAINTVALDKDYKAHVIDAQSNGEEPMSLEDFAKSKGYM